LYTSPAEDRRVVKPWPKPSWNSFWWWSYRWVAVKRERRERREGMR